MSTALTVVQEIQGNLVKMQDSFAQSLPKHIPADRFIAVAKTALINKPDLASLDRQSLYQSFLQAAQAGLMPDNREAAIIPFKGKAKLMPMVAGICKQARNSGEIATIDAVVVCAKDQYEAWSDERGAHFKHVKARGDRGEVILTFAYAIAKDGSVFFEEIDEEEMKKIESMARASDSPWKGPFKSEMRRKSALRRLAKYRLPNSSDLSPVFEKDDELLAADDVAETTPEPTKPSRLGAIIEAQAVEEPTADEAVAMVQEVIPEAKVVKPAAKKPSPAPKKAGNASVTGKVESLTAKDGEKATGEKWRRFACKLGGEFYGTFDSKINDQLTEAVDAGKEVTIEYTEEQRQGKKFRNILSVSVVGAAAGEEAFEMADDDSIPI